MRFQICLLAISLTASPGFCGAIGFAAIGGLVDQANAVVVANVKDGAAAAQVLSLQLTAVRVLKGSAAPGSMLTATLSSPNVINPGGAPMVRLNGSINARALVGAHGAWFLQQSGANWVILPLASGDISDENLYLPLPATPLPPTFEYSSTVSPRIKLSQEIGAAALDPATATEISRLDQFGVFTDLGSDLQPALTQLASSPQIASSSTGLAGLIRLGTPSALISVATSSNLGALPPEAYSQLANAVCEYRNTDAGGIAALGTLVGSTYSNSMRVCSAHALREFHSPATLPYLEKLLDDASPQIQYDAVIGIARYAMSFPVSTIASNPTDMAKFTPPASVTDDMRKHYPAQGLFASNPQEYINYWKTWLAAHPAK